jgi:hypothetical protein
LTSGYFHASVSPGDYPVGAILDFYTFLGDISNFMFITCPLQKQHQRKIIVGVVVTGDKFFTIVNNIGDYILSRIFSLIAVVILLYQ